MKRYVVHIAIVVWFVGVLAAFGFVWRYKTEPGPAADAPAHWPSASRIVLAADRANLVMFTHPQCPCTRASMAELARLAVELGPRAKIHVVLVRPRGTDQGFEEGVIAERAHAIAGADILVDVDGVEADRFGALTSGSTVLYTRSGQLAFDGGLTTARGHEGRSPVQDRILAAVAAEPPADAHATTAPTFGCELEQIQTRRAP